MSGNQNGKLKKDLLRLLSSLSTTGIGGFDAYKMEVETRNFRIQMSLAKGERPPPDPDLYDPFGGPTILYKVCEWFLVVVLMILFSYCFIGQ